MRGPEVVYLTPGIKRVCEEASLNDLEAVRRVYRHVLKGDDLKWLDRLIQSRLGGQEPVVGAPEES